MVCMVCRRLRNESLPDSKWSLGRCGMAVNLVAVAYTGWSIFWSLWPAVYRPTAEDFNWAVVVFGVLVVLALGLYLFGRAGSGFQGPVGAVGSGGKRKGSKGGEC